jgi:hypothetical protein
LVVDLTGTSLFNVANLLARLPAGSTYYNNAFNGDSTPNPAIVAAFPEAAYDTYVGTTLGFAQAPAVPGRAFEPGTANVGTQPPGANRDFDVAWGATPNSGPPLGTGLEIARLTVLGGGVPDVMDQSELPGGGTSVSAVFSSDAPNDAVEIPEIPEPATFGIAALGLGLASLRRR